MTPILWLDHYLPEYLTLTLTLTLIGCVWWCDQLCFTSKQSFSTQKRNFICSDLRNNLQERSSNWILHQEIIISGVLFYKTIYISFSKSDSIMIGIYLLPGILFMGCVLTLNVSWYSCRWKLYRMFDFCFWYQYQFSFIIIEDDVFITCLQDLFIQLLVVWKMYTLFPTSSPLWSDLCFCCCWYSWIIIFTVIWIIGILISFLPAQTSFLLIIHPWFVVLVYILYTLFISVILIIIAFFFTLNLHHPLPHFHFHSLHQVLHHDHLL